MSSKSTAIWLALAAGLFAFIFVFERHFKKPDMGPPVVFPGLRADKINSIQIQPSGQRAIHVVHTNNTWQMLEPLQYPAQSIRVESLLTNLQHLTATRFLSAAELKTISEPELQFGFDAPQYSILLDQKRYLVLLGRRTPPGDQVYLQVVGTEGVFIVDADLLKLIPRTANDWRETALVDWTQIQFDRVAVTNGGKLLEVQFNRTNGLWRMTSPMDTRADSGKIRESLSHLPELQVRQFVSDDPKPDLDSFGLQTPDLSLAFFRGTNTLLQIDFGKSPTNDPSLAFARRSDQQTIVTVPRAAFEAWSFSHSHDFRDFLDPHLVALTGTPDELEIRAQEHFTVERDPNHLWRVQPEGWLADSNLVGQIFTNLTNLHVTPAQIVKDVVPTAALPQYGLAEPFRQYILKAQRPGSETNFILAQLDFGTNDNKLFARVPGESFVYSMDPGTLDLLPAASWQVRDRRVWNFSETNVASVTIQQGAKTRQWLRKGEKSSALAAGSQGMVDEIISAEVEETVHRLGDLSATFWVQRGDTNLDAYGFKETAFQVTVELKSGEKHSVQFGKDAPSKFPYAAVRLNGETWVMEFPWTIFQFVQLYLSIPANVP